MTDAQKPDSKEIPDIKSFIEKSTTKTTVSELAKKGYQHVKILNEAALSNLIKEAVEKVMVARPDVLTSEEREKIYADARKELDRLIKDYQETKKQAEIAQQSRESLVKEVENLQRQIDLTKKMSFEEGVLAQQQNVDSLQKKQKETEVKLVEASAQLREVERVRGKLEIEIQNSFKQGVDSQKPLVENLQKQIERSQKELADRQAVVEDLRQRLREVEARLQERAAFAALEDKIAELAKKDDVIAARLSSVFLKSIDGLSRKIQTLRLKGGVDTVDYRASETLLENLLQSEIESNLSQVSAKEEVSTGSEDEALEKLRNLFKKEEKQGA